MTRIFRVMAWAALFEWSQGRGGAGRRAIGHSTKQGRATLCCAVRGKTPQDAAGRLSRDSVEVFDRVSGLWAKTYIKQCSKVRKLQVCFGSPCRVGLREYREAHLRVLPLVLGTLVFGHASAGTVDLSTAGYVQYGDALSYSLPTNVDHRGDVGSGSNQLVLKVGLGANGQLGNGKAGMDDAYDTPQANNVDSFRMSGQSDPGGLQGGLGSCRLVGFQWRRLWLAHEVCRSSSSPTTRRGNGSLLEDADASLAVWGRIKGVTDAAGTVVKRYDMTNHSDEFR